MSNANTFKASFNRPNLYYEVRPKTKEVFSDIIRFIKKRTGKSGIIYCLSRKTTEQLSNKLKANSIPAEAYHAGLNFDKRSKVQESFRKLLSRNWSCRS